MGRRLSDRGQLALAVVCFAVAAVGIPLAMNGLRAGNLGGAAFTLVSSALLGGSGIRRLRKARGWTETSRAKRMSGVLAALYLGAGMVLLTIVSFAEHTLREQVGGAAADVLGVLAALGAICFFLMSWMVWSEKQSLPSARSHPK